MTEKKYKPTIGLEIHAELATKSKMFCGCPNNPCEVEPNTNVCPVCLAHPGVLPAINLEAVKSLLRVGLALGGRVAEHSKFDRKSYFYPDLPKGYQISQYDLPLVKGGKLAGVELERVHLEEDTARLVHTQEGNSLVDYNRAGVPLMELVTKPVIASADKASEFSKELQTLLRYLGASDADIEKGQMRVEANISVSASRRKLGTKVELKNINSFKAVRDALMSEIERQAGLLGKGERVVQETRGWNEDKKTSFSQRVKEEADDYRYMPEPDLPPMDIAVGSQINLGELRRSLPELPWEKRKRFTREYGFKRGSAELERLIDDRDEARFFEEFVSEAKTRRRGSKLIKAGINYLDSDLIGIMRNEGLSWGTLKITPKNFAETMELVVGGMISSATAKQVLRESSITGVDPHQIIEKQELAQISDERIVLDVVGEVVKENEEAVGKYRAGKENVLKFLVGQTMAKLRGRGNPELVERLLRERLSR